jgi:NADH dehydrogenase FAD-containing subunit
LVIAVGAYSNTFGIPGVKEHAFFLKEVNDARKIRQRLVDCKYADLIDQSFITIVNVFFLILGFEYASQPGLTNKEKEDRLHFVVVGGGPTVRWYAYAAFFNTNVSL